MLVVGCGPSGSSAARILAESGMNVFMVDSRMEIGAPVLCSDLVNLSLTGLQDMATDPRFIISPVGALKISGTLQLFSSGSGEDAFNAVVERDRLDKELASRAVLSGSRISIRSELIGLEENADQVFSTYRKGGKNYGVTSRYVVMSRGAAIDRSGSEVSTGHVIHDYSYARKIGKELPELAMTWSAGGFTQYMVPRRKTEYNEILVSEGSTVKDKDPVKKGISPQGSIIRGSVTLSLPREPFLGSRRVLNAGSFAGLYDPFFMTGFREAVISGELAALSIKNNSEHPDRTASEYAEMVNHSLVTAMKQGFGLRSALKNSDMENVGKFFEYLSGFSFNEISAGGIFRSASLSDTALKELLPPGH